MAGVGDIPDSFDPGCTASLVSPGPAGIPTTGDPAATLAMPLKPWGLTWEGPICSHAVLVSFPGLLSRACVPS